MVDLESFKIAVDDLGWNALKEVEETLTREVKDKYHKSFGSSVELAEYYLTTDKLDYVRKVIDERLAEEKLELGKPNGLTNWLTTGK